MFFKKIWLLLLSIGPGIFAIGYTIGTGSVTSMSRAGSAYGMQLIWVLFLSAFFAWILMEAYGRYAIATGDTSMHGYRKHLRYGKVIALLVIIGVTFGQWNSLAGILGLTANAFFEILLISNPQLAGKEYVLTLIIGIILAASIYLLLLNGRYSFFEKVLIIFVSIMGVAFIASCFIAPPSWKDIASGFVPSIPLNEKGVSDHMLVAAFVGTTMAAPTFVVRPLFLKGKGWTRDQAKNQSRDALSSAILMFIISGAVMAAAAGAIHKTGGEPIKLVLDMVQSLEPVAGRFAVVIFMFGAVSAGLSSIFPIMMVLPLLLADYRSGQLDTQSSQFRILAGLAAIVGLTVLILGINPVEAQIITQVFNVFILPVVIGAILYLVNKSKIMGKLKAGAILNTGLWLSLVFSLFISYAGILGLIDLLGHKGKPYSFEFQELDTGSNSSLRAIHAVDRQIIWASGSQGQVLLSLDGGMKWTQITVPGCEETEFRSLHAWDDKRALVFDISPLGRAFMTSDGGESWEQVYSSPQEGAFFNSVKFSDPEHGMAISDPVDDQVFILRTRDGGLSWKRIMNAPLAVDGEINFAASNTCIEYLPGGQIFIVTGGNKARILSSPDHGEHWQYVETPVMTGASAGLFSIAFMDSRKGVAVGGDFSEPDRDGIGAIYTRDGGKHWQEAETMPAAYRSCVVALNRKLLIATGKTGCDFSQDAGLSWTHIASEGFYAASSVEGQSMIYLAGSQGRIARLTIQRK